MFWKKKEQNQSNLEKLDNEPVKLLSVEDEMKAQIVISLLDSCGIPAVKAFPNGTFFDDSGNWASVLDWIDIYVPASAYDFAKEFLKQENIVQNEKEEAPE